VESRVRYRRLPGRRRGFVQGASVWIAPDHLLLVKSLRFREEYKRYQLQDIQAIAIAHRPRFHISTRAAGITMAWMIAYFVLFRFAWGVPALWTAAAALVITWVYVSAACSCTCRIYTAVSRDDLPSVYRTWVARKFLRAVGPGITAVQGELGAGWAQAMESRSVGPEEAAPAQSAHIGSDRAPDSTVPAAMQSTPFCVLLATLFLDGLLHGLVLYRVVRMGPLFSNLMALLVVAAAIVVLVLDQRSRIPPVQQRLAIATLVAMGVFTYVRMVAIGAIAGARAAVTKQAIAIDYSGGRLGGEIEMGVTLLLSLAGLLMLVWGRSPSEGTRGITS
jgi:hypothetical protein